MKTTATLILIALLAGCLSNGPGGDTTTTDPAGPATTPTSLEHIAQLLVAGADTADEADDEPFPSGSGIWVHDGIVYGSGLNAGFFIADVRDPESPRLLYRTPEDTTTPFSRDADLVHADGRLTLVLATQNDGMHFYDVSDPAAPVFTARWAEEAGDRLVPNHNVAVVPETTIVFNSRSGGAGSTNDLIDVADPGAPVKLGTFGTHGCHDITFHGTPGERFRAYCAGIDVTEIWDLDGFDPKASGFGIRVVATIEGADSPVVGSPVFGGHPARTLHHLAMVNEDASVLIIGDEHNGGGSPGACFANEPETGLSTPLGALWFYDISDETAPALLSWLSPDLVAPRAPSDPAGMDPTSPWGVVPNCTAHFGTTVPGHDVLVMAWYSAGVLLVDFSDPSQPVIRDQFLADGINTWDARVHGVHVFTGDIGRGMDVLRLD